MTLTYNQDHVQISNAVGTPGYIDVNGSISMAPSIASASTPVRGDGSVWATAYGAAEGTITLTWLQTNLAVIAQLNGGVVSASGTTPNVINRYELLGGSYVPPAVIVAGWEPNIAPDKSPAQAGLRTTVPSASFAPATKAGGQETVGEWTAEGTFKPALDNTLISYELLETAPVFTSGLMPVIL